MMPYCSCDLLHTRAPQAASNELTKETQAFIGNASKQPLGTYCSNAMTLLERWAALPPTDSDITRELKEAIEEISPARFTGLGQTTALIAHKIVIGLLERSRSALLASQAASDSVTISRETAEYAYKALEAYTKNMMFTADQAGKVSWYKQELKQALEDQQPEKEQG